MAKRANKRGSRQEIGYADNIAIAVIAGIVIIIAVIFAVARLGQISSPVWPNPTPRTPSPSPSGSDSPSPSFSPTPSPRHSPSPSPTRSSNPTPSPSDVLPSPH